MEKKIASLKAAYAAKDGAKLRKAAQAVVAHNGKHPFSVLYCGVDGQRTVALARRIVQAPVLPF